MVGLLRGKGVTALKNKLKGTSSGAHDVYYLHRISQKELQNIIKTEDAPAPCGKVDCSRKL